MKRGHRSTTASCTDVLGNADQLATYIKRRPAAAWLHFITSFKLDAEFYQKNMQQILDTNEGAAHKFKIVVQM